VAELERVAEEGHRYLVDLGFAMGLPVVQVVVTLELCICCTSSSMATSLGSSMVVAVWYWYAWVANGGGQLNSTHCQLGLHLMALVC
jgi:hypothetical protein